MTTQDPKELLKNKQEMIQQKQQYANYTRSILNDDEEPAGQEFSHDTVPDDQNRMKSVENRQD